jgi:hypothetical protein
MSNIGKWFHQHNRRRCAFRESGSATVEAALVTPVVFLLIFGIIEFGWALHDKVTVASVGYAAARVASTQGSDSLADYQTLRAVAKVAAALPPSRIDYIVVFKASGPTDAVPSVCTTGTSQDGVCNVYLAADLDAPSTAFGCGTNAKDRFWCPSTRKVAELQSSGGPPDHVGVWVKARHDSIAAVFGSGHTFTDSVVLRIEARRQ